MILTEMIIFLFMLIRSLFSLIPYIYFAPNAKDRFDQNISGKFEGIEQDSRKEIKKLKLWTLFLGVLFGEKIL